MSCSRRTLNLIELVFVVLQDPQMHCVVTRCKAIFKLCSYLFSPVRAGIEHPERRRKCLSEPEKVSRGTCMTQLLSPKNLGLTA